MRATALTDQMPNLVFRNPDGTGAGTLRHVSATVVKLFGDRVRVADAEHQ